MFSAFERMVAFRYLRARRKEGFISVIAGFSLVGIALGVATLIVVMAVMNGFREELLGRILGVNGHVTVYPYAETLEGYDELTANIRAMPHVVEVTPFAEGQVMMMSGGRSSGVMVRAFAGEKLQNRPIFSRNITTGSLEDFAGNSAIILGERLAQSLGVGVGGTVTLVSPKGRATAVGTVPRMKTYEVVAIFNVGMYEYDSGMALLPLEAAQLYFGLGEGVSGLEAMLDSPDRAMEAGRAIYEANEGRYRVYDWQRSNAQFFTALQVERNVMFLILTLIILVAAFNIISSLIMLVKDKGRDIAILRTMGASRGMVMRIFFLTGASIGVVGTLAGFALGTAFAINIDTIKQGLEKLTGTELFAAEIYFLSTLPAKVEAGEVATVVGMGLLLSFLATIYPAWRAARLNPAEALRYE